MSVLIKNQKFLYPHLSAFTFDDVSAKIVKAIEKRNWQVPGITVEFHHYGSGEAQYNMVSCIKGENFRLEFYRTQKRLDTIWNDIAAVGTIYAPKQIIEVEKNSLQYLLYVGQNWDKDKDWWFNNSSKSHAKSRNEPRRYLRYYGSTHSSDFVAYSELCQEYEPEGDEPTHINLQKKVLEITKWLKASVLDYILSFPESDIVQPPESIEKLIPYRSPWLTVFSICHKRYVKGIMQGKEDPNQLLPEKRYAYLGNKPRLVPLNVQNTINSVFPPEAYDGYIWCSPNQANHETYLKLEYEVISKMYTPFEPNCLVAISPRFANNIYVVDNSQYEETRKELLHNIAPRNFLTDTEMAIALAARVATLIPINQYKGDYKEPLVLISRELGFDEISWVDELK